MLSEFEARREIVEIGRRLWQRGYVASNDGNISARLDGERILVTPSGVSKGFLAPNDLVVVDADGRRLTGEREPTSELPLHLAVYARRREVRGIVHAHPPTATGYAVARVPLGQCILPEVVLTLGSVPTAEYATPSTQAVVESIARYIDEYSAMLLANHGALALGRTLEEAYFRMETIEHFARIALAARQLGGASPLTPGQVEDLAAIREKLGVRVPSDSCVSCGACAPPAAGSPVTGGDDTRRSAGTPEETDRGNASPPEGGADESIIQAVLAEIAKRRAG